MGEYDGKAYIDYVGSLGPMVLGHDHPAIRDAVIEAASRGLSFGAPTEMEVKIAAGCVTELVPTMDIVRIGELPVPKPPSAPFAWRAAWHRTPTKSLSSKAATTAMPTACS